MATLPDFVQLPGDKHVRLSEIAAVVPVPYLSQPAKDSIVLVKGSAQQIEVAASPAEVIRLIEEARLEVAT